MYVTIKSMATTLKVAIIQLNSTKNKTENQKKIEKFIHEASKKSDFILLPELCFQRQKDNQSPYVADTLQSNSIKTLQSLSKTLNITLLIGSFCEKKNNKKLYNTSIVIDRTGGIIGKYRKIHLFDSLVNKKNVQESHKFCAGKSTKCVTVESFKIGLSICYDLRFPELYRKYAKQGADILVVPSSFTTPTGKAHWETLLRARAIENQCYVLAPNQVGIGAGKIETFGYSMIIDPWGTILSKASQYNEEIIYAELSLENIKKIRQTMPVLNHRKL